MDRREKIRIRFWEGLQETARDLLYGAGFGILLILMLFVHNMAGFLLACGLLFAFIFINGIWE